MPFAANSRPNLVIFNVADSDSSFIRFDRNDAVLMILQIYYIQIIIADKNVIKYP